MSSRTVPHGLASRCELIAWRMAILASTATLRGGLSELKIDVGPGYRVYYTQRGDELIILLVGGDKSSQQNDIALAQDLARNLKE
jgi:putative addiction module killer protein